MEINEKNKELYELAFIENGEYGYHGANWKPSIDEREISSYREDSEGNYVPATPLGYRDYKESRLAGLKNIFAQCPSIKLTEDRHHKIKRNDGTIKQYDKIVVDSGSFIVTGDDEKSYFVTDENDKRYYVPYVE